MSSDRETTGEPNKKEAKRYLEFFCRHLVALCITYQTTKNSTKESKIRFSSYPGVVICIRDFFAFLTAGHALKDIYNNLEKGTIILESAVLADTFGPGTISEQPIPFDLLNEPKFFIHDKAEGLDFGLIALKPYYIALLAKHGIKAIFEKNWINQNQVQFDAYTMLGLPEDFVTFSPNVEPGSTGGIGRVVPTMIEVKAIENLPDDITPTTYPRFIGQINMNLPLKSIVGMSGGPIFDFRYEPPMAYWVVAIQSSWLRRRRVIFGCPLPILGELLTSWIDNES